MVNMRRERLTAALDGLQRRAEYPDGLSDTAQEAWMDIIELEAVAAGHVLTVLRGGEVPKADIRAMDRALAENTEWALLWPEHFDLLSQSVDLLLYPDGGGRRSGLLGSGR